MILPEITLLPLQPEDREQFILDNQWAFKYGAQQEFVMRDERCEEGEEVISRKTITPYFEKRNIHFYVNRCGFHIVEFWNKYQHGPAVPEEEEGNWSMDDEMFVFRKAFERGLFMAPRTASYCSFFFVNTRRLSWPSIVA